MGKRKVGGLDKIEGDLINLQNKIRRDPLSYSGDFQLQYEQYIQKRELFKQSPDLVDNHESLSFIALISLISHVADCYKAEVARFPEDLSQILRDHHDTLHLEVREKIVDCLGLLSKKGVIDPATLIQTLFPILITTTSKNFRTLLFRKILSEVRNSNSKTPNHRLNRTFQGVLFNLLRSERESAKCLVAVKFTRELWKRGVWKDSKAVEIMKEACLTDSPKAIIGGVGFFLGGDKERAEIEEESDDEEEIDIGQLKHQLHTNKKTKKKQKQLEQAAAAVKRREKKKNQAHPLNFSALHLLNDPQALAEALFERHLRPSKGKLVFEQRLLVLQLVSRLVGLHKLTIESLYSYYIKLLKPKQEAVTKILACLAQSSHSFVPPDELQPLVTKIANEFVSETLAAEVVTVGINAIREICARQPLAMTDTLLQDLVQYKKSKDKGVMMAAKGLLSLYREVGADMLKKKDRGKAATLNIRSGETKERRFGEVESGEIEGLELLEKWKEDERKRKREEQGLPEEVGSDEEEVEEDEGGWDEWEVASADSSDGEGWMAVASDDDAPIEISDSDDNEQHPSKKAKLEEDREKISKLLTTTILTPADLAKLQELRLAASLENELGEKKVGKTRPAAEKYHPDDGVTAEALESLAALSKRNTKEEKLAAAAAGKTDRSDFKSSEARRKERKAELGKSTTNKEKARKKNVLMTIGKARSKRKRSLVEQRRVMHAHAKRAQRGGRRGNY